MPRRGHIWIFSALGTIVVIALSGFLYYDLFVPRADSFKASLVEYLKKHDDKSLRDVHRFLRADRSLATEPVTMGLSPFGYLARRTGPYINHRAAVMDLLLAYGADIDSYYEDLDIDPHLYGRVTVLHAASYFENESMVYYLLEHGATPNAPTTKSRSTPLHIAAWKGNLELIERLVKAGANVNAARESHETPLLTAILAERWSAAELLRKHGAILSIRYKDGTTALQETAVLGKVEVLRYMLEHGADPNTRNQDGDTPLDSIGKQGSALLN